jgi:hypothetical protein
MSARKISITRYEHHCKRCDQTFRSGKRQPMQCNKCRSAYWDIEPRRKSEK